ncbi:hypothetical protein D3C85_985720 [compost metagenome]
MGHQVLLITAVQGLAVDSDIGAGNAFQGNDQHVACTSRGCQQSLAGQVELGEPCHLRGDIDLVTFQPVLRARLNLAHAGGQHLVRQVEHMPLVGIGRLQVLRTPVSDQQRQRHRPGMTGQARCRCRSAQPVGAQPRHQSQQQGGGQPGLGESAAGGVFQKLRIDQVMQVRKGGQPADRADQFGGRHGHEAPGQQYRQGQPPGATVQEHDEQARNAQVRQVAMWIRPAQRCTQAQGHDQNQSDEGDETRVGVS